MASLSIKNVSKTYRGGKGGQVTALRDVSLEINEREFVVIAGPAGCGKSTLLRLIGGLEAVSHGEICIGEKRVNDLAPKHRDIAMVFQDHALYPHLSVYDNLAFGLRLRKFSGAEIKNRVRNTAGILGIEALLDRKANALVDDQRTRVAIARAVVRQAKFVLFDDPLLKLDDARRGRVRTELPKLHQRLQATLIYATRSHSEAMTMANRIVVLNDGAVQQIGTPLVLYHEPANLFVAGFFGSPPMNFISGALRENGQQMKFIETDGGSIEVSFSAADRSAAHAFVGKEVVLGIRPEDLEVSQFSRKEAQAAGVGFPAIVDAVEPIGAETNLHLQTGAHNLLCRSRQTFDHRDAGRRLQFEINLARVHLFDPVSTRRLG